MSQTEEVIEKQRKLTGLVKAIELKDRVLTKEEKSKDLEIRDRYDFRMEQLRIKLNNFLLNSQIEELDIKIECWSQIVTLLDIKQ